MILVLLHLCDSLFPLGGFAYSEGLEAATTARLVSDTSGLRRWLDACLDEVLGRLEGPALVRAWSAFEDERWDALVALDQELAALRPSSSARRSSAAMGRRLVATWHELYPERRLAHLVALVESRALRPALPLAFAAACASAGIAEREAAAGFFYSRLAATISTAMRLMAIGQNEAHGLLARLLDRVPAVIDRIVVERDRPEAFAPALDVAVMTHQYVHSKLFRS